MSQVKSWREPDHGPNDWILEVHDRLDGSVPYENFRSSLNEYTRAVLELSQIALAERAGITQADLSRLEQGKGNPTFATIKKIMNALQLKLVYQREEEKTKRRPRTRAM